MTGKTENARGANGEAKSGWRQSMAWIHTWLGLLAGWILFAMFLTGTASYFRPEITRWMQPEVDIAPVSAVHAAMTAVAHMQKIAPQDEQWTIFLPDDRTTTTRIFTRARPDPDPKAAKPPRRPEIRVDPATGDPVAARETKGGEHFYRFHFQLQIPHPWGRWLAGLAAIFMLAAIISGVITHKRIFVDFFTLRWGKGQRSWLDAHNVSAVIALPFHAMITYTGLITLVAMYMPWPVAANYQKPATFADAIYGVQDDGKYLGRRAPLTPIGPLIERVSHEWHGGRPATVIVRNPNDAGATIQIARSNADTLNARGQTILFSGSSGRRIAASQPPGVAIETAGVMLGLHMGNFAGPLLRWTYVLLGMTGTAMVGTGLLLWTAKRRREDVKPFFGFALVERLNIGTVACLPAGMAAFLLANRLLPADLAGRADIEVAAMYWTWFGLALLSLALPVRRAWIAMLGLSAASFLAIPIVNMITTDRGFFASIARGDLLFASFDMVMLSMAVLLGFGAWRAAQPPKQAKRVRKPRAAKPPIQMPVRELTDAA